MHLIGLALVLSCGSTTGTSIADPGYSWRGRILDSLTRAPVGNTALQVREQEALEARGFFPFLDIERFPNNLFLAQYILHGFRCRGAVDTSLTLHLEIVDSLGRYQTAVHESNWLIDCKDEPGGPPEPFPNEDSLVILLQPVP